MYCIKLNGKRIELDENNLEKFLIKNNLFEEYYAVAVNQEFIPKNLYKNYLLQPDDEVEILMPMQGG